MRITMRTALPGALLLALLGSASIGAARAETPPDTTALAAEVRAREQAFAKTMADRDLAAFAAFVSKEAVFVGKSALRGREAVVAGWKPLFEAKAAPFSWTPERVEVVDSGTLALSTGPVFDAEGKRTGTFHTTWRREEDGVWRALLDTGCPPCECR